MARPVSVLCDDALDDSRCRLRGSRQRDADSVEQRARGGSPRGGRRLGCRDEV
jgi:hypothetical protein